MSKDARPEFIDTSMPNTCYAKRCGESIPTNRLMCWPHWKRVPRSVQAAIWESNYLAHPEHALSRLAARASIAAKEGLPLTSEEIKALSDYCLGLDGHPLKVKLA